MDFDLIENKSGLGTAGIVVINKQQDIVACMLELLGFTNTRVAVNVLLVEKDQVDGEF